MVYKIYTDGAASGNGKADCIAGWAYVVLDENNNKIAESSGAILNGTNNIGELTAIIESLYYIKMSIDDNPMNTYLIHSDSAYCINGITSWRHNWKRNDWWRDKGQTQELKNRELWIELDSLIDPVKMRFIKVKGHADNNFNNYVDKLAVLAVKEAKENEES